MITCPITDAALRWHEVILAERFGHTWQLIRTSEGLRLHLASAEGAILFDTLCVGFTQAHSDQPCTRWDAEREGWATVLGGPLPAPGVTDLPAPLIEVRGATQVIHYDILGLTYWMLARVEEIGRTDLDNHERFPAVSSHAHKHDYLDRPVVDEWLHLLGQVIQRQWPGLVLKRHEARTLVSCDVDTPFALEGSLWRMARRAAGDVLRRHSLSALLETTIGTLRVRRADHSLDSYFQGIEFIMDVNERAGRAVAFYFIPENTDPRLDNSVSLDDPRMRTLMREICARGHNIGIHPGYNSYRHPEAMSRSVQTLRRVLDEEKISQTQTGGRQHFLRWETSLTACLWDENGLTYDSTLGYADRSGFRCGTCFEYPFFDAIQQRALRLRERPLIVMECSVISERYMGLGYSERAFALMHGYRDVCHRLGGDFTLLWHNSHLNSDPDKRFYGALVT